MLSLLAMLFAVLYDRMAKKPNHPIIRRFRPSPAPRRARLISGGRVLLATICGYMAGWAFERARQMPWGAPDDPASNR